MAEDSRKKDKFLEKHHSEIQMLTATKDKEILAERKERSKSEREAAARLESLQAKMETMLKQRDSEIREELEYKLKSNKGKHVLEVQRLQEIIRERQFNNEELKE